MSYEDELTATCLECGSDLDLVRLGKWQCAKCDLDELLEQARAEGRREELEPMECGHPCAAYVDEWQACGWCKEVEEARAEGAAAERERLKPIMLAIGAGSLVGGIGSQTEATIAAWEGLARAFDKRKVERHGWAAHFRRIAAAIRASAEEATE